ncbi:MAG: hypothetical protein KDA77_08705, partial [Planctomycetaceae bacterium]|nr:hypothetical protein [Planctomycetaceae bacterium]
MLAFFRKLDFCALLITLSLLLAGCGRSDSTSQRRANSNPFAPADNSSAPSPSRSTQTAQTKQPAAAPSTVVTPPEGSKEDTQKKPEPVAMVAPDASNIISETSKRTLDSKSPGIAIIVRGVSGNEAMALPVLQQNLRSSFTKQHTPELQNQEPAIVSARKDDVEHFVFDKQLVLVVRPVPADLFAFAQKLKWGKVKEIDLQNRIITVDTQLQELNSLAVRDQTPDPAVKVPASANSMKSNENDVPAKPAMKQPENQVDKSDKEMNDRDLKPRPG